MTITQQKALTATPLFGALVIICFFLDAIDIFGARTAPGEVADLACSLLPFASISEFSVSSQLLDFAINQCKQNPIEPASSIIFFMTKISLALSFVAIYWAACFIRRDGFAQLRADMLARLSKGGLSKWANSSGSVVLGLIMFCFYLLWKTSLYKTPEEFARGMYLSKLTEDLVALLLSFVCLAISVNAYFIVAFLRVRRRDQRR